MAKKLTVEDFHLESHIIELMWEEPFFGTLLRRLSKTPVDEKVCPTAGVTVKDGELLMVYNPEFMVELMEEGKKKIKGLLKHEMYHLILDHVTSRRRDPPIVWNYATDSAINSMIARDELPDKGTHPGERPLDPQTGQPANDDVANIIANLPREKASDWYFEEFMKKLPEQPECPVHGTEGCGGAHGGCDDSDHDHDGDGECDGEGCTCQGKYGLDDHGGWDMEDADRELGQGKIRHAVEEAVKKADQDNGWGTIPAHMREYLRELISNQVDWKAVLKAFIGYSRAANYTNSIKRINRRYPYIHPGRKRTYTANIAVMIDMSGSVGNDDIELFFGELKNLAHRTTFTVGFFDTEVDEESVFEWKKGKKVKPFRGRCGGTDFQAPTDWVNKRAGEFDGLLILSDGECGEPGPCKVRRGWVICPDRQLMFKTNEMLMQMTRDGKAVRQ